MNVIKYLEQLKRLKQFIKISNGDVTLPRIVNALQLANEDDFVTFLLDTGLEGIAINWESNIVNLDDPNLVNDLDDIPVRCRFNMVINKRFYEFHLVLYIKTQQIPLFNNPRHKVR